MELYLNFNSSYELFVKIHDIYFNALILVINKNLVCVNETLSVSVFDSLMNYVDGAVVYYGNNVGVTRHGKINIIFEQSGVYSIRAVHPDYNSSRKLSVLVSECSEEIVYKQKLEELIKRGEISNVSSKVNFSIKQEIYEPYSPRYFKNYTFTVPDEIPINTTGIIRVLDINGSPYRGVVYIISPTGKIYRLVTDEQGYGVFVYQEEGVYEYYVIEGDTKYPGPNTKTYIISSNQLLSIPSIPGWIYIPALLLLLLRVAKVDVKKHDKDRLIIRVTNILGSPIRRTAVIINDSKYITDDQGIVDITSPPSYVRISIRWYLTLGKNESKI
ncbi:MAG: hypothetical protein QXH89_00475 [Candidatus Anstonellales archaeon]